MTSSYALKMWCKCGRVHFIDTVAIDDFGPYVYVNCKCGRSINEKCKEAINDWKEYLSIIRRLFALKNDDLNICKLHDLFTKRMVASGVDVQEYEER